MPKHLKDYKDKEKARKTRNRQRRKNYAKTAGWQPRQWTEYEDRLVLEHSVPDRELSTLIGRSVQSIQIRRSRIKRRYET